MRGGKREGAGRKKGSVKEAARTVTKQVRWTSKEWESVETAAAAVKETPSDYQRKATLDRISREIQCDKQ